ncbi:MAG: RNase adapter RapZ [Desulfuromonas sp.]|nr:MAG: RNase adapter RapZ [Desulfuromonas sp.]
MSGRRVLILTGMSGSGKSTAARALEDRGYFVVDNLPLVLLQSLLDLAKLSLAGATGVAVVVDVRNREFLTRYPEVLEQLKTAGYQPEVTFFDATDGVLVRRYSETRRRHPLADGDSVKTGIERERELLQQVRTDASVVIDSSGLTPRQLGIRVLQALDSGSDKTSLIVQLESFGYRYGLPASADLVFDVRFLPNPHYIDRYRPLTGLDETLRHYVIEQPASQEFLRQLKQMLGFLLPHYRAEGKSYLTVAIGCTGGRHRSVSIVEALNSDFPDPDSVLHVSHRDIDKG